MSKTTASAASDTVTLLASATAGLAFGFALEKGQVFSPQTIVGQMLMKDFTMLKMFLSAASTSMLVHSVVSSANLGGAVEQLMCRKSDRGVLLTVIGGIILGSGMALAGSCPGTVLAQIGAGQPNSHIVFFSGLLGATLYAFADRMQLFAGLAPVLLPKEDKITVALNWSYSATASIVASLLAAFVAFLEFAFPSGLPLLPSSLAAVAWSPITAGVIVGSLQLPMLLVARKAIGSSSAFVTLSANCIGLIAPETVKSTKALADAKSGTSNWLQPLYLLGAVAGAFLAASLSHTFALPAGVPLRPVQAALGGVLLLFGARLANGCTSGHGISGFSLLGKRSISATAAMFAGGIVTAFLLRALGQYPAGI